MGRFYGVTSVGHLRIIKPVFCKVRLPPFGGNHQGSAGNEQRMLRQIFSFGNEKSRVCVCVVFNLEQ